MQHWEILKAGRVKVSETPQEFFENACNYFKWCDDNPITTKETISVGKKAGDEVDRKQIRPYTTKGLCIHCGVLEEWLKDMRDLKDPNSLWYNLVTRVLYIIYVQNLELATVGVFNPIFVSKVLNMEKEETPNTPTKVYIVDGLPPLSETENQVLQKLELEMAEKQKL